MVLYTDSADRHVMVDVTTARPMADAHHEGAMMAPVQFDIAIQFTRYGGYVWHARIFWRRVSPLTPLSDVQNRNAKEAAATDSPRVFVKFMKTLVELLRSPQAGEEKSRSSGVKLYDDVGRCGGEKVDFVEAQTRLFRNEKKGHWEPTQVAEHLGLEMDLKDGLFRVTEARLWKIHLKAKALICRAAREQ
ncbi:hypothetical protein CYMTET_27173 [Cymbomonas tetramitiformis]|uniref:Uncharacterized protein n=1 Tax=Cymbomonas tetramitiformis TaxID=36881 RepID=A0AAE0KXF6_9CHLO|nr:hypothetical protein CYMTET_27173 [Cymbomonas tetramitiformis]